MKQSRLFILLANALEYIEECTNCGIMEGDIADALGITQEEYDEVMSIGTGIYCSPNYCFKIVERVPKRFGMWPIGDGMGTDKYVPFCESQLERGPHAINPDTLLAVALPREEVLLLRKASAVGSTIEDLKRALRSSTALRWISEEKIYKTIEILKRITEEK